MDTVLLTALFVGGATIVGGAVGLFFRSTSKAFCDAVLSFAAGVMLAASMLGLILPSLECGGEMGVFTTVLGIFLGAFCVNALDMLVPVICGRRLAADETGGERIKRVLLFVMAIALHNLPEGIAADAFLIATAIALQNIPEGLIVTVAMLGVGIKPSRAFLFSALTGVVEIFGTFIGYLAINISSVMLPLILALAGGTMLYVISEEMIPETHSGEGGRLSTYFLLIGFSLMLIFDAFL